MALAACSCAMLTCFSSQRSPISRRRPGEAGDQRIGRERAGGVGGDPVGLFELELPDGGEEAGPHHLGESLRLRLSRQRAGARAQPVELGERQGRDLAEHAAESTNSSMASMRRISHRQ